MCGTKACAIPGVSYPAARHAAGRSCSWAHGPLLGLVLSLLLGLCTWATPVIAAANKPPDDSSFLVSLNGKQVRRVLADYTSAGHEFAYSKSVVTRRLRFGGSAVAEPGTDSSSTLAIGPLRTALAQIRLELIARGDKRWLIRPLRVSQNDSASPEPVRSAAVITEPRIEEVVVISSRYKLKKTSAADASVHNLSDSDLNALPELGDDALRATLHLPGMATVGVSAKPHVRGGSQDEILVLYDGVELFEPYHLRDFQSVFSSLNPALIESIDVYTGGFPARYGDRMSAVVDIEPRSGHTQLGGDLAVSFLTTSGVLRGPLAHGRGDWTLSARRGNLDWVTKQVNPKVGDPSYSDWLAQFSIDVGATMELSGTLVGYDDDVVLSEGEPGDGEDAQSRYANLYGWLRLERDWSEALTSSTLATLTRIRHHRSGSIVDEDIADSNAVVDDRRKFRVFSLQQHFSYRAGVQGWDAGIRLTHQRGSYDYSANIARGELAQLLGLPVDFVRNIRERPSGYSGAAYGSGHFKPFSQLVIEAGLRFDFQNFARRKRSQISPRLSARYDLSEVSSIRMSGGRFYQAEGIHELEVIDGFDRFQGPQRADHFILAYHHDFPESGFSLRAELFHKRFSRLNVRFENLFNPLVMLPELASDRVAIAANRARAQGFELSLGYDAGPGLTTWASYTWAKAEDQVAGRWVPRSWDQEHTLSTGLIYRTDRWELSASLLTHSGWPTTNIPAVLAEDEPLSLRRNRGSLPNYVSVDLRLARRWERGRHSLLVFAEVTNALARDNIGSVDIDIEEDEDNGSFTLATTNETVFPWIPSIGLQWSF